jgi:sugar transferase EpsL
MRGRQMREDLVVFGEGGRERRAGASSAVEQRTVRCKRMIDLLAAVVSLVVLSPVLAIIALAIRASMGRPILFRARRPGLHARTFTLLKFRTMKDAFDLAGNPLPDKLRITPVGRFLRRSSLDELPQLFNVLKGEMSLVGPRPLKVEYLQLYTAEQARRHEVKPGITGLAQINGRNTLSWEKKFELDVWYVDHLSLLFDLQIVLRTIAYVLKRRSISADGDLDVPSFTGSLPVSAPQAALPGVHGGPP